MIEPIVAKVTRYRCPFCRRARARKKATAEHMAHCFKNPERAPRIGELTCVGDTGSVVDYGSSSALPGGMSWLEWNERAAMPAWWPGVGKIWDGAAWRDVPGYRVEYAEGAHGCAGGAPPEDVWPEIDGTSLWEIPASSRVAALFGAENGWTLQ